MSQRCYKGVKKVSQRCHNGVTKTKVSQRYQKDKGVAKVSQRCHKRVTKGSKLQMCNKGVTKVSQRRCNGGKIQSFYSVYMCIYNLKITVNFFYSIRSTGNRF